jgi:hypothetical protein
MGVSALRALGKVAAPLSKVAHPKAFETLRRARLEFCGTVVSIIEENTHLFASGSRVLVDEGQNNGPGLFLVGQIVGQPFDPD